MPEYVDVVTLELISNAGRLEVHRAHREPSATVALAVQQVARGVVGSTDVRAKSTNHSIVRSTATSQRGRVPHTRLRRLREGQDTARLGNGNAAEDHRFGDRHPLRGSSIGGPWQLRGRSIAKPPTRPSSVPGHQAAGAQAPRHLARSDATNTRQGGRIGDGSPGKANSMRAAGPRGRGA